MGSLHRLLGRARTHARGDRAPVWPFGLNRSSPQIRGLEVFFPLSFPASTAVELNKGWNGDLVAAVANPLFRPVESHANTTRWSPVRNTYAFTCDVDNYVQVGGVSHLFQGSPFSFSIWARHPFFSSGGDWCLFGGKDTAQNDGFQIHANGGAGSHPSNNTEMDFTIQGDAVYRFFGQADNIWFGDRWHHVAMTWEGDGGVATAYIDGVQQGTQHTTGAMGAWNNPVAIGAIYNGNPVGREWKGQFLWARVASVVWTAEEVAAQFDPRTRWDLAYELARRTYFLPTAAAPAGGLPAGPLVGPLGGPLAGVF